jgi:hypothetical protein
MLIRPRRALSVLTSSLTLLLMVLLAMPSQAAEKSRLHVDDYQIEAELEPHLHQITARAKVRFTAEQDLPVAVFELNNDLRVTKVVDEKNQPLSAERVTQDSSVRVPLPAGLAKGASMTLTFEYEGQLENADNSPVPGLKLAYIGDDTSLRTCLRLAAESPAWQTPQPPRSPMPACCRPRLLRLSPPNRVFPEQSWRESFRSTKATKLA